MYEGVRKYNFWHTKYMTGPYYIILKQSKMADNHSQSHWPVFLSSLMMTSIVFCWSILLLQRSVSTWTTSVLNISQKYFQSVKSSSSIWKIFMVYEIRNATGKFA